MRFSWMPLSISASICVLAMSWSAILSGPSAEAATSDEPKTEFACGTVSVGGGFYAEAGRLRCENTPLADQIELKSTDDKIFCSYSVSCTPATTLVKEVVLRHLKKKDWTKLRGDEIARALQSTAHPSSGGELVGKTDWFPVAVQCLGNRTSNGNPDCPNVNDCVNNRRTSGVFWRLKPTKGGAPSLDDVEGLRAIQEGEELPTFEKNRTTR